MTITNLTVKQTDVVTSTEYHNLKALGISVSAITELSGALAGTEYECLVSVLSSSLAASYDRVYLDFLSSSVSS